MAIGELLSTADPRAQYSPGRFWARPVVEKVGVQNMPFFNVLCQSYQARLQGIRPVSRGGYYFHHHRRFIEDFIDCPDIAVRDTPSLMLVGFQRHFDRVESVVNARRAAITAVSGREPKKIAAFIADGESLDKGFNGYRAIGMDNPPDYSYAIAGALDVYINSRIIDRSFWGGPLDPDRPVVGRVIAHEPSHALWNGVFVDGNGEPTWQLDKSKMVYEALAGPPPKAWEDVDTSEITVVDFTPLETSVAQIAKGQPAEDNFGKWFDTTARRNRTYREHPMWDPVYALFYQWVHEKGDERYWYELAKKLPR